MPPRISLKSDDRNALLRLVRCSPDPRVRLRAHVVLLLADGYSWELTVAVLFTSSSTIARWQRRFRAGGVAAVGGRPARRPRVAGSWAAVVVAWVLNLQPADRGPRCVSESFSSAKAAAAELGVRRSFTSRREQTHHTRRAPSPVPTPLQSVGNQPRSQPRGVARALRPFAWPTSG